jgi:phosphoglycolate phosphatase
MLEQPLRAVVFDFDYTLADSSEGVVRCTNYALQRMNLPPAGADAVRRTIGLSLEETFVALAGQRQEDQAATFKRLFVERADEVMVDHTVLLAGAAETTQRLRDAGLRLAIVSTKYRYRIATTLRRERLLEPFDVIVGGQDVRVVKPDPEGLLLALDELNVGRREAVYVGDSVTDAETAQRADVPFVATLTGVTPRHAFEPYPRLGIVERLVDLSALLGI